jgi:subtilase family serine protease
VWNPLGLCRPGHLGDCVNFGAGGGGNSTVWGRPVWQHGPGVNSSFNTHAPSCLYNERRASLPSGFPCRSAPDVSANADEFTPYAEFCTGNPSTNSTCATFSAGQPAPGWFGIGGTSLSSPVWSAIIGLWDSFHHARYGNASEDLYNDLFSQSSRYSTFYHDITGVNQQPNTNGFFPVTPNYDEATGIGTPRITGIAESHE